MKFALNSVFTLLLFCALFACRNAADTHQETTPLKEEKVHPIEKSDDDKGLPTKLQNHPKEQKSDRRNHKKKNKNALDTLRPKTA